MHVRYDWHLVVSSVAAGWILAIPSLMNDIVYDVQIQTGPATEVASEPLACDRCGSFALLRWSWGRRLCAACIDRQHPMLSSGRTASRLIAESVRLLSAIGIAGVLIALVPLPLTYALRTLRPIPDSGDSSRGMPKPGIE